jgi:uncharacterized membrane protein
MEGRVRRVLLALVMLCVVVGSASAANCLFTDLGLPSGTMNGYPTAVSPNGLIIGQAYVVSPTEEDPYAGSWQPFKWANGVFTQFSGLDGDVDPYPVAVNNNGDVVGWSYTAIDNGEYIEYGARACVWQDGVPTALQPPAGARYSAALGINDAGLIAGVFVTWSAEWDYWAPHACVWIPQTDGSYVTAQPLDEGGGPTSRAGGVNNSGQIAGFIFSTDPENEGDRACRWDDTSAAPTDLGPPPQQGDYFEGIFLGLLINDSGLIVGNSYFGPDTDMPHGLIWPVGATTCTMLTGLGGVDWGVSGLNNAGLIVGSSYVTDNTEIHACLWNGANPAAAPFDLAAAAGLSGYCGAVGIDAAGHVVGGYGVPPDDHNPWEHAHWCVWWPVGITYTGNCLVPAGSVSLGAQLTSQISDVGSGVDVTFTLTSGSLAPVVVHATTGEDGAASASANLAAGVYDVAVSATVDELPVEGSALLVVYDPNGGFVTGHGTIDSPAGAFVANAELAGKAMFGFVSKSQKGKTVPIGTTLFQFKVADLSFHSESYDWLVVAGAKAQYKGTGTINNAGAYAFMLTAIDGDVSGGGGVDKFRIKIWDPATDTVVYDNQMGGADSANPTTALASGDILIHKQ